jgi:hypothetical protein
MNISFTELDNVDNNNNNNNNNNNYWEPQPKKVNIQEPKKKRVSYDDILNSLNLVVNKNGTLQYMTVNSNEDTTQQQKQQQKQLDPEVKNSYIFNKYFKDYKDPNAENVKEVRVPQTIEEYKQIVLEERIKRIQERNRIAQIKSTKLLFVQSNSSIGNNNIISNPIRPSKNNLRMMKFG